MQAHNLSGKSLVAAGDILAARVSQMLQAGDQQAAEMRGGTNGAAADDLPEYLQPAAQCVAARRQLLAAAMTALWGAGSAPHS